MNKVKKRSGGVKDTEAVVVAPKEFEILTYDHGFKIVFGTEGKSERLLMTLLHRVLGMKIVSVKYLPTERLGFTEEESRSFFDVYCKDSSGRRFLIEMQMWSQHYFHKRAVYYSSLSVQDQARVEKQSQKKRGRVWDYYFAPVYQVSFLNFPNTIVEAKDDGGNPYISHYVYRSKDTGRELGADTNIIFIDLQKFRKDFDECEDMCEKWLYSIRNMHLLKERPAGVEGTELEELYDEAHYAAWPAEKRMYYERYVMNKNDIENIICEHYEDGYAAGRAEGREEGREEGILSGVRSSRIEMARKLYGRGMSVTEISELTSLSEDEVKDICCG